MGAAACGPLHTFGARVVYEWRDRANREDNCRISRCAVVLVGLRSVGYRCSFPSSEVLLQCEAARCAQLERSSGGAGINMHQLDSAEALAKGATSQRTAPAFVLGRAGACPGRKRSPQNDGVARLGPSCDRPRYPRASAESQAAA